MNTVLQQQLRNAGQQVGGTGELLLQAADEIARLKTLVAKLEAQNAAFESALLKVRDDVNGTVHKTLGK